MALAGIFAFALGLRVWGIGFGLPQLYHPDEPAYVLQALAIGARLPNGLTFADPPLFKYVLLAEYAGAYGWDRLTRAVSSPREFVDEFRADPSRLYLIARATSALFGSLTSLAAYLLGTEMRGRQVGLLAATFGAVAFLLVRDAHFGVNDALVTVLVALGLVAAVRVLKKGRRRDYLIAGALAGLAFAAKYYGLALLVPVVLAHVWRTPRKAGNLVAALAACVLAAVAAFPSLVSEPTRVIQDVYAHLFLGAMGGYDGLDPSGGYAFYATTLAIGLGWPLLLAGLAGLVLSFVRRDRASLVVASLPVVMLGVLGAQHMYFARFALPVFPALVVQAAIAIDAIFAVWPAVGIVVVAACALPTAVDAVRFDMLVSQTDTRTLAANWVDMNLPPGSTVAVDASPLGPTLAEDRGHRVEVANEWSLFDLSPAEYRARGIQYVVVSSFTSEARAVDPAREARRQAFLSALQSDGSVVERFAPFTGDTEPPFVYDQIYGPYNALDQLRAPGPVVTVYRWTE